MTCVIKKYGQMQINFYEKPKDKHSGYILIKNALDPFYIYFARKGNRHSKVVCVGVESEIVLRADII